METTFFSKIKTFFKVNLLLRVKGLVILPLMTGYLGTLSYGEWSQFLVLIAFVQPLILLGTDSAILRVLPSIEKDRQPYLVALWFVTTLLLTLFVLSVFGLFFNSIIDYTFGKDWSGSSFTYFVLCSFNLLTVNVLNLFKSVLRFQGLAKVLSRGEILKAILHILVVVAVLLLDLSVIDLIFLSILLDVFVLLYFFVMGIGFFQHLAHLSQIFSRKNSDMLKKLYSVAIPFFPGAFLMWGINYVDRFFIVKYHGLELAAAYAVSFTLSYIPIQVIVNSIWYFYPSSASHHFESKDFKTLENLYSSSISLIIILMTPIVFFFFKSSLALVTLFTNESYVIAHMSIPILTLAYTVSMLEAYSGTTLSLVYKHFISTIAIFLAFIINILLNYYLIPKYGSSGAAISTLIAFITQFLVSFYWSQKYSKLTFPWGHLSISLVSSVLSYTSCSWAQDYLNLSLYYELGLYVFFGLFIYISFMYLFGIRVSTLKFLVKGFS